MPKNLVVIVLDTLRHPDHFAGLADGSSMPFLRSLMDRGTSFSHAVASSCWTPPSHVSLLSGTDPWATHFHIATGTTHVPRNPFLADLWRSGGGGSVGFSANWLVGPEVGTARGYDVFNPRLPTALSSLVLRGLQVVGFEQLMYARILRRTVGSEPGLGRILDGSLQQGGAAVHRVVRPLYSGMLVARSLAGYLKAWSRSQPLHVLVNLMEMHEPYLPPRDRTTSGLDLTYLPSVNLARHTQALEHWGTQLGMMVPYRDAASRLDRALRNVVERLRVGGVLDDATLLVVSDHGQGLGENGGFFGHAFFLYDELVRVPAALLEFRHGEPIGTGRRVDAWVDLRHLFDLAVARGIERSEDPTERLLEASVAQRGPATAFWEGPPPHPPRGFLLSAPTSSYHRSVRVFSDAGCASIEGDGPVRVDERAGALPDSLVSYAERAVGRAGAGPIVPGGRRDPEVDRRLRSWGYD